MSLGKILNPSCSHKVLSNICQAGDLVKICKPDVKKPVLKATNRENKQKTFCLVLYPSHFNNPKELFYSVLICVMTLDEVVTCSHYSSLTIRWQHYKNKDKCSADNKTNTSFIRSLHCILNSDFLYLHKALKLKHEMSPNTLTVHSLSLSSDVQ